MTLTDAPSLAAFEVYPGIEVTVPSPGTTGLDPDGPHWAIRESKGLVHLFRNVDLADETTWDAPFHEFRLRKATDKHNHTLDTAGFLVREGLRVITRFELDAEIANAARLLTDSAHPLDLDSWYVRIEADLVKESAAPEQSVAAICDALKGSHEWMASIVEELEMPGMPDFNIAIEIPLGPAVSRNVAAARRLKVAADLYGASYLDVVKSVDEAAVTISSLPSLVAVPYTHIHTTRTIKDRFDSLLQTFEAVVRYMATVALIPVAGTDRETRLQGLATHGRTPSVTKYVEIVRNNLESLSEFLPEVVRALDGTSGETPLASFIFSELADLRNQVGPHGGNRPDGAYLGPAQTLHERLEEIVAPLSKDTISTVLVVQTNVKVGEKQSTYDYDLIELRTDKVYPPRGKFSSDQKLEEGKVYLLHSPSSHFILADPLVRYDVCPECGLDEAFFLDHFGLKAPQWFTFRGGHRIPQKA